MTLTRRELLKGGAFAGVALVLGTTGARILAALASDDDATLVPNPLVRISSDGGVEITTYRSEMGQGARTALALIAAGELGADWSRVRVVHARPGPDFRPPTSPRARR